jgi:hypothetical protein
MLGHWRPESLRRSPRAWNAQMALSCLARLSIRSFAKLRAVIFPIFNGKIARGRPVLPSVCAGHGCGWRGAANIRIAGSRQ